MGAEWVKKGDKPAFAYADWDMVTRPDFLKDFWYLDLKGGFANLPPIKIEFPSWRPVYVRIRGKTGKVVRANAQLICNENAKPFKSTDPILRLADDGQMTLGAVIASTGAVPQHQRYLFLYLPEYAGPNLPKPFEMFEIVRVGPAVPGLSLLDTLQKEKGGGVACGAAPPQPLPVVDPSIVVTAVIDTEIGIANERFCSKRNNVLETRVHHFWRQQRETIAGIPGLGIGREFDRKAIHDMLDNSKGDERQFYALLRSVQYGQTAFTPGTDRVVFRGQTSDLELFQDRCKSYGNPVDSLSQTAEQRVQFDAVIRGNAPPGTIGPRAAPYSAETDSRPVGIRVGHGTAIADLAAGYPVDQAPSDRPIVAVELPDYVIADTNGARLEVFALMAVRRILNWVDAWDTPAGPRRVAVVITISLGNSAGPRDGTGFLETEIARLVDARNADVPTKVVLAAGNTYRARLSGRFDLADGKPETVDWVVLPGDKSPSFLEIRVPKAAKLKLSVTVPGLARQTISLTKAYDLESNGQKIGRVYSETEGKNRLITLALAATAPLDKPQQAAPPGAYRVEIFNKGPAPVPVKIDVQRDDSLDGWPSYGRQSYLDHPRQHQRDPETGALDKPAKFSPVKRSRTLSAYVTNPSENVYSVGGAFGFSPPDSPIPTLYTSSGPSAGKVVSPDMAAVTEEGRATPGRLVTGFLSGSAAVISGTSCAAPQLTRALVEMLVAGKPTTPKAKVYDSLLPKPVPKKPNLRLGHGVLPLQTQPGRVPRRRVV